MPFLDVSEILSDPDFADTFTVTRSVQTITSGGLNEPTITTFPNVVGVVTANDDIDLLRTPEAERLMGSVTIHTTFLLTNGSGSTDADVVTWNGRDYTVTSLGDWSRFGRGFIHAICTLKPLNP